MKRVDGVASSVDLKSGWMLNVSLLTVLVTTAGASAGAGDLDPDFGTEGLLSTDFGGAFDRISAIAVRADGKLAAVGMGGPSNRFAMAVYESDGTPDGGFDSDGQLIIDQTAEGGGVAWLDGGKLLIGCPWLGGSFGFMVARLNANGSYDTSFGSGGKRTLSVGTQPYVEALELQDDGRIILAGYSYFTDWEWVMARFTAAGAVDTTFWGGTVRTDFGATSDDMCYDIAIQPNDGKIVAGGSSESSPNIDVFTLARYHSTGSLDLSFGVGGKVVIPAGQISTRGIIYDVEILPDGKILACGSATGDSVLLRFDENGNLDDTFGSGGAVVVAMSTSTDFFESMTIDGEGRIIAAGSARAGGQWRQALARFRSDGSLDPAFGTGGKVIADFDTPWEEAHAVALTPDEEWILLGGSTGTANVDYNFSLSRYSNASAGSPRTLELFGLDGEASTSDGTTWSLTTTTISVSVDRRSNSSSEQRGVLEFDVRDLPAEASVLSAELYLDIAGLSYIPGVSYPFIEVYGYDGDGVLQAADATLTSDLIGASEPLMTLDPTTIIFTGTDFIESLRDRAATHLGLVLRAGRADHYASFMTTEGVEWGAERPKLTIGYVVDPLMDIVDLDKDGDVDEQDVLLFANCAAGPAVPLDAGCEHVDFDTDGDGDQADFAEMQRRLTNGSGE